MSMFTYQARYLDAYDGDTAKFLLDMGMYISSTQSIRFVGVEAPELDEPNGKEARDWVRAWFELHRSHGAKSWPFIVDTLKDNRSFNRYLGTIRCADCGVVLNQSINRWLEKVSEPAE